LGGSQALSRSLFSQMVPRGREATFFGLYEICDRGTSWIAPLLFTLVVNQTGSFRQAILSLIALFAIGIVILAATDADEAKAEAAAV
jgi:UMF1 family MFS transporter